MLLLALEASRLQTGPVRGDWLPSDPESVRAVQRLEEMGRGNVVQILRVLLVLPAHSTVGTAEGWTATRRLAQVLENDARIARARCAATDAAVGITHARLKELARDGSISQDERSVLFEVLPRMGSADALKFRADAEALARSVQAMDASAATGLPGSAIFVGGLSAINTQFEDAISGRFHFVVALVVGATFIVLALGFRSVLVAIKAIALNLFAVAAAFGAVLVFQDGRSALRRSTPAPVGFSRSCPSSPSASCSASAWTTRSSWWRESPRRGVRDSASEAIVDGLARTGGVITSAGSIMIAVFARSRSATSPVQDARLRAGGRRAVGRDRHAPGDRPRAPPAGRKVELVAGRESHPVDETKGSDAMKRFGVFLLVSLLAAATLRAAGAEKAAGSGGVQQLNEAFLKAMQSGDIDGVMKLYAADAVLFPPGEKAARGQDEIRFKWADVLKANKVTDGSLTEAKYVSAATVSAGWGNVSMRLEPKNGKEPKTIQGRFSTVAEKRNGKWSYIFVYIGELDEVLTLQHYSSKPK